MEFIFHTDVSMIKGYIEESHDNIIKNNYKNNKNEREFDEKIQ